MNPEEMAQLEQMAQSAPQMTEEQMAQQAQQDEQLAQAGVDPEKDPEAANQLMGGQGNPEGMPQEQMNPELAPEQMDGGFPFPMDGQMMGEEMEPDPSQMLPSVILAYMDFAIGIKEDKELDKQVKSKIMAEQASALSALVPLLTNNGEMELMKMRHEMDLKYQEHQMDMEMKQQEMEMKKQEQEMNLQFKAQENQVKLQTQQEQQQMKLQQQHEQHQTKLVQSQESHQTKMEQQKQAAQSKQGSNPSND